MTSQPEAWFLAASRAVAPKATVLASCACIAVLHATAIGRDRRQPAAHVQRIRLPPIGCKVVTISGVWVCLASDWAATFCEGGTGGKEPVLPLTACTMTLLAGPGLRAVPRHDGLRGLRGR